MYLIDAHCHFANLAKHPNSATWLNEARNNGIGKIISNALSQEEVFWHQKHPQSEIVWHAGIHPHYQDCDLDIDMLRKLCEESNICALGECGMDRNNKDLKRQIHILKAQVDLAVEYHLPLVLHIVGHPDIVAKLIMDRGLKCLIHGFAGSLESYRLLSSTGAAFTISSRICKADKHKLLTAMLKDERYCFETDITSFYVANDIDNPFLELHKIMEFCSRHRGISELELMQQQFEICKDIFGDHIGTV